MPSGDARSAYAVEAVASGDEVARQLARLAVFAVANLRRGPSKSWMLTSSGLEHNLTSGCEPRRDQILDDFVLRVDRNGAACRSARSDRSDGRGRRSAARGRDGSGRAACSRSPTPVSIIRLTVPCSSRPARTRSSTYRRLRASSTTDSMPARCSRCDSIRPAGPAPTMPTCVRSFIYPVNDCWS